MILEHLEESATRAILAWARKNGPERPAPVAFTQPPGHVKTDVCLPWPLSAGKALKRKPLDVAEEIAAALKDLPEIESAEASPPGFVNLRLSAAALGENLAAVLGSPGSCGSASAEKRRILIEYVSANPTGPVHLASGRAATLGDSLARILRRLGHTIATEYYVNDVGRQIELLGLSVKARWDEAHGKDAALPEDGYKGDYIKDLAETAPAEASGWDPAAFGRFALERMLSSQRTDMESFGVKFDRWFRESELHESKALDKALEQLKKRGRVAEKDGAIWLSTAGNSDDDKDRVLIRKDGRPTYFLGDIAYHQNKLDRGFKELIDIWGADHHGYVPRMKDAIAALGHPKGTFHPIVHQMVRLFRGKQAVKMSKRAGEFVTLKELTKEVGPDACRFFFARHTPNAHMNFDIELAKKRTQENPVYYVQYVHARIASIFREAKEQKIEFTPAGGEALSRLKEPAERDLLIKIAWFPSILRSCEKELSPHPLPTYLMELGGLYHVFYEKCRVLDKSNSELCRARMTLCRGVQAVIADGLALLGVSAPERM